MATPTTELDGSAATDRALSPTPMSRAGIEAAVGVALRDGTTPTGVLVPSALTGMLNGDGLR